MACILGAGTLANCAPSLPRTSSCLRYRLPEVVEFQPGRPCPCRHGQGQEAQNGPPRLTFLLRHVVGITVADALRFLSGPRDGVAGTECPADAHADQILKCGLCNYSGDGVQCTEPQQAAGRALEELCRAAVL